MPYESSKEMLHIYAVSEYAYCQRSAFYSLIGSEEGNNDNAYIQRGRGVHGKVDEPGKRYRQDFEERKGVYIKSYAYGLTGKADLLRVYENEIVPVDYKSGHTKTADFHRFQLTLQALCIEEQMETPVKTGLIYFYQVNETREYDVEAFKPEAKRLLQEIREKLEAGDITAFKQVALPSCVNCSFYDICMPELNGALSYE